MPLRDEYKWLQLLLTNAGRLLIVDVVRMTLKASIYTHQIAVLEERPLPSTADEEFSGALAVRFVSDKDEIIYLTVASKPKEFIKKFELIRNEMKNKAI